MTTATNNKEPLIKISKRQNLALKYKALLTVGAIVLSLVLASILLACLGYNPIKFFAEVMKGNFTSPAYLKLLVRTLIPLLITALGVSLAFKMRFWNIGAEGQFIMGALIATTFSMLFKDALPSHLGAIIVVLLGAIGGGLYAVIVALLKVKFNTNETLLTLMFNYIALYIAKYTLFTDFFATSGTFPSYKVIDKSLWLTEIKIGTFAFDTSLFVAIALVVIFFIYFKKSKQGYELNIVGDSPNTAKYAGMKVGKIVIRTMFLSGAVIGLAGALKLTGSSASHMFSPEITGGVGWTAIIVAWLAKLNPIGVFVASFLLSVLERGCEFARTSMSLDSSMSDVLQGIILFTILASDFFINYKVTIRSKRDKAKKSVNTDNEQASCSCEDDNTQTTTADNVQTDIKQSQNSAESVIAECVEAVQEPPEKRKRKPASQKVAPQGGEQ